MSASENVTNIVLNAYLECPVCLDFAASPIHTRKNGHIVCGICEVEIKICPTCQAGNLLVNDFVERVLKAEGVVVPCRNSQHGCTLLVQPSEMKTHLAELCDFRPIKCRQGWEFCGGKSYHPKDLFKHWLDVHEIGLLLPSNSNHYSKGLLCTVTSKFALSEKEFRGGCWADAGQTHWELEYAEIDGRKFILHYVSEEGILQYWVTLLGMESEAAKFGFVATLGSYQDKPQKRMVFPMIPIHSLQYYCTERMDALGHTAAIPVKSLKLVQEEKPSDPKYALEWNVKFDIFSLEDAPY